MGGIYGRNLYMPESSRVKEAVAKYSKFKPDLEKLLENFEKKTPTEYSEKGIQELEERRRRSRNRSERERRKNNANNEVCSSHNHYVMNFSYNHNPN